MSSYCTSTTAMYLAIVHQQFLGMARSVHNPSVWPAMFTTLLYGQVCPPTIPFHGPVCLPLCCLTRSSHYVSVFPGLHNKSTYCWVCLPFPFIARSVHHSCQWLGLPNNPLHGQVCSLFLYLARSVHHFSSWPSFDYYCRLLVLWVLMLKETRLHISLWYILLMKCLDRRFISHNRLSHCQNHLLRRLCLQV